jgi:hypothetical protein
MLVPLGYRYYNHYNFIFFTELTWIVWLSKDMTARGIPTACWKLPFAIFDGIENQYLSQNVEKS